MNTHYLTRVRNLFNNPLVEDRINRHNRRQWVKSVRYLGDKWLLKIKVERK